MYLNELMKRDYTEWKPGESIFIEAGTGMGKTTFILDCLLPYALQQRTEILFLSNRFLLREQVKTKIAEKCNLPDDLAWLEQVEEFDGISVTTYQKIQKLCNMRSIFSLATQIMSRYRFVILDECHYLLADATFNSDISFLLELIKQYQGICIFMSATMDGVPNFILPWKYTDNILWRSSEECGRFLTKIEFKRITSWTTGNRYFIWRYCFPVPERKFEISYFSDLEQLLPLINNNDDEHKWLIFLKNKSELNDLSKKITVPQESLTADNRNSAEKRNVVQELLKNECFQAKVLLTTAVLDNGVNISDSLLKNVVLDTNSKTEFLQMLGRRRVKDYEESLNLYIPQKTSSYFSCLLYRNIETSLRLLDLRQDELMQQMLSDTEIYYQVRRFFSVQDGKLVCNPAGKFQLEQTKEFMKSMIENLKIDSWAFVKAQLSWIGQEDKFSEKNSLLLQKRTRNLKELEEFLNQKTDVWMNKMEQEEFCSYLLSVTMDCSVKIAKGARLPKKNLLNKFFKEYGMGFEIVSKPGKKRGEETVWKIIKIEPTS